MSQPIATARASVWTPAMVRVSFILLTAAQVPNLFVIAPRFLGEGGADQRSIGWVMGSFNLAALFGFAASGLLARRHGHARTLAAGALVSSVGAAVFALAALLPAAGHLPAYLAGRVLQGLGFSVVMAGSAAYVAEVAPTGQLGQVLGVAGVMTLVAQALGPVVAEAIHDAGGWPWVWRAAIVAGVFASSIARGLAPAPSHAGAGPGRMRAATAALVASALAGVGFGSIWTFLAHWGPEAGVPRVTAFFVSYVAAAVTVRLVFGNLSDRIGRRAAAVPALCGHAAVLLILAELGARWHLVVAGAGYGLCHGVYYPTLTALVVERAAGDRSRAVAWASAAFGVGIVAAAFGLGPVARAWGYPTIYVVASASGALAAALVARRG